MNSKKNNPRSFYIKTLGCKVNQYEEQLLREDFVRHGLSESDPAAADIVVINSCTVTHKADREVRRLARRFARLNPGSKIVVTGCLAVTPEDRNELLTIDGVSEIITNERKRELVPAVLGRSVVTKEYISGFSGQNRAFIKVQDGCDNRCSYCKVSIVRGPSRSREIPDIIKEVKAILASGFKEIVLTGICLGDFRIDQAGRSLETLVGKLLEIPQDYRIRLSSIEPQYAAEGIIRMMRGDDRLCPHLHIPLQSGSDRILKLMNRKYDARGFAGIVDMARTYVPDIAFTTDIITGFPGEDKECFDQTVSVLKMLMPSRTHIFTYSPRKGTAAFSMKGAVPQDVVKKRAEELERLNAELMEGYARRFIGRTLNVLVEYEKDSSTGKLCGYTGNYIKVVLENAEGGGNRIVPAEIISVKKNRITGRLAAGPKTKNQVDT